MQTVKVQASTDYTIYIESGLLKQAGEYLRAVTKAKTAVIVTDDVVNGLYADTVEASLKQAGFATLRFVFPNGEASKTSPFTAKRWNFSRRTTSHAPTASWRSAAAWSVTLRASRRRPISAGLTMCKSPQRC